MRRERREKKQGEKGRGFKFMEGLGVKTAEYYLTWTHYTVGGLLIRHSG